MEVETVRHPYFAICEPWRWRKKKGQEEKGNEENVDIKFTENSKVKT